MRTFELEISHKIERLLLALAREQCETEFSPLFYDMSEEQDDVYEDIISEMAYHALDAMDEQFNEVITRRRCELQ